LVIEVIDSEALTPFSQDTPYKWICEWPSNVRIFGTEMPRYLLIVAAEAYSEHALHLDYTAKWQSEQSHGLLSFPGAFNR